ncbi:hypothetical protein, partial [Nioella sp. MMSF_3534]|uniref:hypothetical protein n=1 Tax=Nioella sp. MMSF_3534 TaxID=3046720 RepID=UPI00273FA724
MTVDMVPLVFLTVALALVVSGEIISGVADASRDTADHLDGNSIIVTSFNTGGQDQGAGDSDGTAGSGGWTGGSSAAQDDDTDAEDDESGSGEDGAGGD